VPLRSVYVELGLRVRGWQAGIATARQGLKDFNGELDRLRVNHREKFDSLARNTAIAGIGLSAAFLLAAKSAMEFDKQMSAVDAAADTTSSGLEELRAAALQAGKATSYSATQAAQAEEELAKADVSVKDILGGGLAGALNLAAAGQMDLADAATIAAQAMNIFGLNGAAVPHIADVLAAAANKSAADMKGLGDALKQGGLLANQAGLSLEETTGTLAAFADRALIGSDAGTSLKTMLQMLANPAEKTQKVMAQLGIDVYNAQGNFVGITRLAGILQEKLSGLTQAERDAAMAQIFGSDATRAANVLYKLGEQGLQSYIDAVDDSGAAAATAAKKTDNLAGDLERLKGSIETVAIEAGSGANGGLRTLVKTADALVSAFSDLPGPVQSTITILGGVSGASLLAMAGLLKVRQTISETIEALSNMGPAGARAAGALKTFSSVATKLGLVGLAIGGIWTGLDALSDWAARKHAPLKADIDKLTASMQQFASTGKAVGELAEKYGQNLEKIGKDAVTVAAQMDQFAKALEEARQQATTSEWDTGFNRSDIIDPQAEQRIKDLDTALAQLVNNGHAVQAALFLDQLRASGALSASEFATLTGMMPQYSQATKEASTANSGLAKGFADAATQNAILNSTLSDAISKGQTLTDVWNTLHGAILASDKAMLDANKAIEAVKKSFEDNGKAIKGNSTAALENRVAIEEAARAAAEAAQAKYTETGSIEEANKVYGDYATKLKDSLRQAGLLTAGVAALIDQLFQMPPTYATTIKTPGLTSASSQLDHVNGMLDRIDGRVSKATVILSEELHREESRQYRRWGGITEHAATGLLKDAGIYSTASPARYAFAEPSTGGEAFVPKNGDYGRSMAILSQAAAWYGASVQPGGSSGPASFDVHVYLDGTEITNRVDVRISERNRQTNRRVAARR